MSAELLREAASLMRERAKAANKVEGVWFHKVDMAEAIERAGLWDTGDDPMADGEHIASWHPAVALAVADWLDGVALLVESKDDEEYFDLDGDPLAPEDTLAIGSALTVARAYLGSGA